MSTYSPDLRIELIANGAQAGTWGTTTNDTWAYVIDPSITGFQTVAVASANQALTYVSGSTATASANQAIYASLAFTTGLGTSFSVYAPPNPKQYIIWNNSSQSMTLYNSSVIGNTTPAGTGVTIPAGNKLHVFSNGTNFYAVEAASLTGTLAVANGGTGVTTLTGVAYGNGTSAFTAATGSQIASAIGSTAVTNATNATNLVSGGTIASNVTATTQSLGTNNTTVATTAFVLANTTSGVTSVDSATGAVVLANLAAFGRSLAANGYQKLPGGLIIQWGTGTIPDGPTGTVTVTFPTTFPNAFLSGQATLNLSYTPAYSPLIDATTTSSMRLNLYYTGGAPAPIFWLAVGY